MRSPPERRPPTTITRRYVPLLTRTRALGRPRRPRRSFGHSTLPAPEITEAQWTAERRGRERFRCEQPPYLIGVRAVEQMCCPPASATGSAYSYSPLAGGWLSGRYRTDHRPDQPARRHDQLRRQRLGQPGNGAGRTPALNSSPREKGRSAQRGLRHGRAGRHLEPYPAPGRSPIACTAALTVASEAMRGPRRRQWRHRRACARRYASGRAASRTHSTRRRSGVPSGSPWRAR